MELSLNLAASASPLSRANGEFVLKVPPVARVRREDPPVVPDPNAAAEGSGAREQVRAILAQFLRDSQNNRAGLDLSKLLPQSQSVEDLLRTLLAPPTPGALSSQYLGLVLSDADLVTPGMGSTKLAKLLSADLLGSFLEITASQSAPRASQGAMGALTTLLQSRGVEGLTPEDLRKALGATLQELTPQFGRSLLPIAPKEFLFRLEQLGTQLASNPAPAAQKLLGFIAQAAEGTNRWIAGDTTLDSYRGTLRTVLSDVAQQFPAEPQLRESLPPKISAAAWRMHSELGNLLTVLDGAGEATTALLSRVAVLRESLQGTPGLLSTDQGAFLNAQLTELERELRGAAGNPEVQRGILNTHRELLSRTLERSEQPVSSPHQLKELLSQALAYEPSTVATASGERPVIDRELGSLLAAISADRAVARGVAAAVVPGAANPPLHLIPMLVGGFLTKLGIQSLPPSLTPLGEQSQETTSGKTGGGREFFERLEFSVTLPSLGLLSVAIAFRSGELLVNILCAESDSSLFLQGKRSRFEAAARGLGFTKNQILIGILKEELVSSQRV